MRDKLIQLKKTFDTLYWGADLSLLRKCLDERVRFIRYEILILILSGITMYITDIVARGYGFVIGLLVMFLYKWFLSNLNLVAKGDTYGFLKWLLGTLIALILAFVFCDNELNYIRQNEKCAFYKTKSATKFQKQQTPIAKVCCFF